MCPEEFIPTIFQSPCSPTPCTEPSVRWVPSSSCLTLFSSLPSQPDRFGFIMWKNMQNNLQKEESITRSLLIVCSASWFRRPITEISLRTWTKIFNFRNDEGNCLVLTTEFYIKRVTSCWFSHPSTVSWGRCRHWRGTVLARESGQCTLKVYADDQSIWLSMCDDGKSAPVKVFDHAFQLLKFFHTKFMLLQQPDCACSDILTLVF